MFIGANGVRCLMSTAKCVVCLETTAKVLPWIHLLANASKLLRVFQKKEPDYLELTLTDRVGRIYPVSYFILRKYR